MMVVRISSSDARKALRAAPGIQSGLTNAHYDFLLLLKLYDSNQTVYAIQKLYLAMAYLKLIFNN